MKKILFSLLMLCGVTAAVAQPSPGGGYTADSYSVLKTCIENAEKNGISNPKITLTANIYLMDEGELCNTFKGTLDGNGFTIYAGDSDAHHDDRGLAHGKYLFTYSEGATFKNLTFKDFRADTDEHPNWSILTSQATNCTFENITFDHVSIWSNYNTVGAVAGIAKDCTFTNITVKNSDFTVDDNYAGAVVGYAKGCDFTDIEVNKCDVTTNNKEYAGGVVGYATDTNFTNVTVDNSNITAKDNSGGKNVGGVVGLASQDVLNGCVFTDIVVKNSTCTAGSNSAGGVVGRIDYNSQAKFSNIKVQGCFISAANDNVGGITGYSQNSNYTNCEVDDQTCVFSDGIYMVLIFETRGYVGGIAGFSSTDVFSNCINSALIAGDGNSLGGIAGIIFNGSKFENCINTGIILSIDKSDLDGVYAKYKNKSFGTTITTVTYGGKEYKVQMLDDASKSLSGNDDYLGGIAGVFWNGGNNIISNCINYAPLYSRKGDYVGGIVGYIKAQTQVVNCLTAPTAIDGFPSESDSRGGIAGKVEDAEVTSCLALNNMRLIGTSSGITASDNYVKDHNPTSISTSVTEEMVACGRGAHDLNQSNYNIQNGISVWEQNIGTEAYPTPTGSKGVYHSRSVKNTYGTICLTFAAKSDENVKFYLLDEVNNGEDKVTLSFKYVDRLDAGWPAIFSVAEPGDITITPSDNEWAALPFPYGIDGGWNLKGTFDTKVFDSTTSPSSTDIYYISDDKIRNAKKATIAPCRAYFIGPSIEALNGSNGAPAKSISFVVEDEDGETTAIEFADFDSNSNSDFNSNFNGKTYSIMGTQVNEDYRGIVIKNGKKYLNN